MARVLIIEDNDVLNRAYTFMLKSKGYEVESARNGQAGLKLAERFKPQVILLDYAMPIMDGREFLKHYDVKRKHQGVKVLLLTNMSEDDKMLDVMKMGVYKYFLKAQTEPRQLLKAIGEITKA